MTHTLDITTFRTMFPQFADPTKYPDAVIQMWFDMAYCAFYPNDTCVLSGECLDSFLYLMAAHIGTLLARAATGSTQVGSKTQATIDKVTVAYSVPPFKNGWEYWLSQTPYGLQLWAMMQVRMAGGFYFNGRPESAAFRKVGGRFHG